MDSGRYAQVKLIFSAALAMSQEDRADYLGRLAEQQPDVVRDVESLLKHHDSPHRSPAHATNVGHTTVSLSQSQPLPSYRWPLTDRLPQVNWLHWFFAIGACLLLVVFLAGMWIHASMHHHLLARQSGELQTLCDLTSQSATEVVRWEIDWSLLNLRRSEVHDSLLKMLRRSEEIPTNPESWHTAADRQSLTELMEQVWGQHVKFSLWNRDGRLVAGDANRMRLAGQPAGPHGRELLMEAWRGKPILRFSLLNQAMFASAAGGKQCPPPGVLLPIFRSADSPEVMGALLICTAELDRRFQDLFANREFRGSGEAYAFNRTGHLLVVPRHFSGPTDSAGQAPLLCDLRLRDPGVDTTTGRQPTLPEAERPLTKLVQNSLSRLDGQDLSGYRDYRGRMVVGAWKWSPEYEFGVAVEIDQAEVMLPLRALDWGFLAGGGLLLAGGGITLLLSYSARSSVKNSDQQVGDYQLLQPLGEGGMGTVYQARHAWLERIVAVKILKPEIASPSTIRRFSREVQIACKLQHPATVDIYDYGCTNDGRFYYAMEYLNGVTIIELVRLFGPLSVGRAVYLLRQACGSLKEAHERGVVHRDVKPQNIMVCLCGGEADVVKVLDFGLVKESWVKNDDSDTMVTEWIGTPRYTAPERLLQPTLVDARSDIYSMGAVAYLLLTGHEMFEDSKSENLLKDIILVGNSLPNNCPPLPDDVKSLLLRCVSKECTHRPQTMVALLTELEKLQAQYPWTSIDSAVWWRQHLPSHGESTSAEPAQVSESSLPEDSPATYHE